MIKNLFTPVRMLIVLGAAVALAGAAWLLPSLLPHTFAGTLLPAPQPAYEFSMPSTLGRPLALSELRGQVVLLFFGYTSCPDICPAALGSLKLALQQLGAQAERVRVMMVTVDPERDTLEKLKTYLNNFDPQHMIGLSGSLEQTAAAAKAYGVFYEKVPAEGGAYTINHTASMLVIDPQGNWRELFSFGIPVEGMASDLAYFLK